MFTDYNVPFFKNKRFNAFNKLSAAVSSFYTFNLSEQKREKNVPEKNFLQRTYIFIFPKVYNFSINPTDKKKKSLKKHKIFVISKPQQKASFVFYVIKNS